MNMKNKIYSACDQRICNCPEWVVLKNKFIIVDDWNKVAFIDLQRVDDYLLGANFSANASGVTLCFPYTEQHRIDLTKTQFDKLKKDWAKYKKENKIGDE